MASLDHSAKAAAKADFSFRLQVRSNQSAMLGHQLAADGSKNGDLLEGALRTFSGLQENYTLLTKQDYLTMQLQSMIMCSILKAIMPIEDNAILIARRETHKSTSRWHHIDFP